MFQYVSVLEGGDQIFDFTFGEDKIEAITAIGLTCSLDGDGTDATVTAFDGVNTYDVATLVNVGDTSGWTQSDWML